MADEQPYFVMPPPQTNDVQRLIHYLFTELNRVQAGLDDLRERATDADERLEVLEP